MRTCSPFCATVTWKLGAAAAAAADDVQAQHTDYAAKWAIEMHTPPFA